MASNRHSYCRTKVRGKKKWRATTLSELDRMAEMRALMLGGTPDMWKSTVAVTNDLKTVVRNIELTKRQAVKTAELVERAGKYSPPEGKVAREVLGAMREDPFSAGVRSMFSRDSWVRDAGENVATMTSKYQRTIEHHWADGIVSARKGLLPGATEKRWAHGYEVIRALYGQAVDDAAATASAKGFAKANDFMLGEYNRWGGDVKMRQDFNAPNHEYNLEAVKGVTEDEFVAFYEPIVNPDRMFRARGWPIGKDKAALRTFLGRVYKKITEGDAAPEITSVEMRNFANQWVDPRAIQFKDGDAWKLSNERFGKSDPIEVLQGHLERRARLTAAMRVLGPRPDSAVKALTREAERRGAGWWALNRIGNDWAEVSGKLSSKHLVPRNLDLDDSFLAKHTKNWSLGGIAQGVRHLQVASKIGRAVLKSGTDFNTMRMVRKLNGLPPLRLIKEYARGLPVLERRKFGVFLQLGADEYISGVGAGLRIGESIKDGSWASKLAEYNIRASGLAAVTGSRQKVVGAMILNEFAEQSGEEFGRLHPRLQNWLGRHAIGAREWSIIAASEPIAYEGVAFKHVLGVEATREFVDRTTGEIVAVTKEEAESVAYKLHAFIERNQELAVPTHNPRARAAVTRSQKAGTAIGETLRNVGLFKNYSLMQSMNWLPLMLQQGPATGLQTIAELLVGGAVMGVVGIWASDFAKGQLPTGWDDPDEWIVPKTLDPTEPDKARGFWLKAMAQGGGLGILGDFFLSESNRYGQSVYESLAGPAFGASGDAYRLFAPWKAVGEILNEQKSYSGDVVRYLSREVPLGSLWYAGAVIQRAVFDQLEYLADPAAERRWRAYEKKIRKDYGSGLLWRKGAVAPGR